MTHSVALIRWKMTAGARQEVAQKAKLWHSISVKAVAVGWRGWKNHTHLSFSYSSLPSEKRRKAIEASKLSHWLKWWWAVLLLCVYGATFPRTNFWLYLDGIDIRRPILNPIERIIWFLTEFGCWSWWLELEVISNEPYLAISDRGWWKLAISSEEMGKWWHIYVIEF